MVPGLGVQIFATLSACFGAFSGGTVLGYSSPAGLIFLRGEGAILLTEYENGWVSSISTLGAILGGPISGWTMKHLGRRDSIMFSGVPFIAGWLLIVFANSFYLLLAGRFIGGISLGITTAAVPIFISELSSSEIHGALGTIFQITVSLGILFSYVMGIFLTSFRYLALACVTPVLFQSCLLLFCKESPTYLLIKGKEKAAIASLKFYRGQDHEVTEELKGLQKSIDSKGNSKMSFSNFKNMDYLKRLFVAIGLFFFFHGSGINVVLFNMSLIFEEAGSNLDSNTASMIVVAVHVFMFGVCSLLVDKVGGKPLLVISAIFMSLAHLSLGWYFYLKMQANGDESLYDAFRWIPIASLITFCSFFAIGYGSIPYIMIGEIFTSETRDFSVGLVTAFCHTFSFIVTVTFPPLQIWLGYYGVHWIFSGICFFALLFAIFCVPETISQRAESLESSSNQKDSYELS